MWSPFTRQTRREPWNKGKLVGQKAPLKLKDIWAIRVRLELSERKRELALFNLAIDSKLRGCDLGSCGFGILPTVIASPRAPSSCSRKPSGRSSSKSPSRPARRSWCGFDARRSRARTICFRAACDAPRICPPGGTRASSRPVGHRNRAGRQRLWHPHDAPNQGVDDLPADQELARRAAAARPF